MNKYLELYFQIFHRLIYETEIFFNRNPKFCP